MKNNKRDLPGAQNTTPSGLQPGKAAKAGDLSRQRRKLIKASAAAVPAIMTLRSGSVAAMASVYQCLNHPGADPTSVDPVLGDGKDIDGNDIIEPPHDEWLRVAAKPGKICTYEQGGKTVTYYCLRVNGTTYLWDDIEGWEGYYDIDKSPKTGIQLRDKDKFMAAWPDAVDFYCLNVESGSTEDMVFINEYNETVTPTILSDYIDASSTLVLLLCYFNPDTNEVFCYPAEQGEAMLVTGSCLCSINPSYQIL